jgi:hypothetical protein
MRPVAILLASCLVAACGSGRSDAPAASVDTVQLEADAARIGGAQYDVELGVRLRVPAGAKPALAAATIDLPPQLTALEPGLRAATALVDLQRGGTDRALRVLAGDARNVAAAPLRDGPLFWLRLAPTLPRTPGTYRVTLRDLQASTADGALLAAASAPTYVDVVVE